MFERQLGDQTVSETARREAAAARGEEEAERGDEAERDPGRKEVRLHRRRARNEASVWLDRFYRSRRLREKHDKERRRRERMGWDGEYQHYTNQDNPFGDGELTQTFVWNKKLAREGLATASRNELDARNKQKQMENKIELEKVTFLSWSVICRLISRLMVHSSTCRLRKEE